MATLGLISLNMRVSIGEFTKDLGKAAASVAAFAAKSGAKLAAFGSSAAKLGGAAVGFDSLRGKVLALGGALTVAAIGGSLVHMARDSLASVAATGKLADRLGSTTSEVAGLEFAAESTGTKVESLGILLQKFGGNVANAAAGTGPAALALRRLGLDAKSLLDGGTVAGFKQVADALLKVESPAERSALAMQVFGEEGLKLGPLLAQGSSGLDAFTAQALKLGIAFDRVDAAKVEQANAALAQVGGVVQGLGNQLAIGLAPYITAAAEEFTRLATDGSTMASKVGQGIELVVTGLGYAVDAVQVLSAGFKVAQAEVAASMALAAQAVAAVTKGFLGLLSLLPGVRDGIGATAAAIANDLDNDAKSKLEEVKADWAQPWASQGVTGFFDRLRQGADRAAAASAASAASLREVGDAVGTTALKVADFETKLREELATFGKTGEEVELYKLKLAGATDAQLANAQTLIAQKTALDDSKKILEATTTPLEKYQADLAKLRNALTLGVVSKEQFARGADSLKKNLAGTQGEGPKFASALELGSAEATSTVARFRAGGGSGDAAKDTARNTREQLAESRTQTVLLRQLTRPEAQPPVFSF